MNMNISWIPDIARNHIAIIVMLVLFPSISVGNDSEFGMYEGELIVKPLADGRNIELVGNYSFIGPSGTKWSVPDKYVVDGASIPQFLWSVVGGPLSGKYRNASVIHDRYCDIESRPWKDVHRMFYYAMRASGVTKARAKLMYSAVYRFGPRWDFEYVPECENCSNFPRVVDQYQSPMNNEDFSVLRYNIENDGDISLDEIDRIADEQFTNEINPLELGEPNLLVD